MPREASAVRGKRVTARLSPETYAGLTILKYLTGHTLEQLVETACARMIAADHSTAEIPVATEPS